MTIREAARGAVFRLEAQGRTGGGAAQNINDVELTISDSGSVVVAGFPVTAPAIVHDGLGAYHYDWTVPGGQALDVYTAHWDGTGATDGAPIQGDELFEVIVPGSISTPSVSSLERTYLTEAQFRARSYGVSLAGVTSSQIRAALRRSASALHAYTGVPPLYDFRGGAIVGETHTWRIDPYESHPQRRIFPRNRPVIEVTRAALYATKNQYLEFSANEIYYESSEGWIEPASANLTSFGLFGAALMPFIGLEHPHLAIDYNYGWKIPTTVELEYSGTGEVWRAPIGFWDEVEAVGVMVNGNDADEADYNADRREGTVTFVTNLPSHTTAIVEATFVGRLPWEIPEAQGLIAAARLTENALVTAGLGGMRRITVAELTLERDTPRGSRSEDSKDFTIPDEAQNLLDPFVVRALAFG